MLKRWWILNDFMKIISNNLLGCNAANCNQLSIHDLQKLIIWIFFQTFFIYRIIIWILLRWNDRLESFWLYLLQNFFCQYFLKVVNHLKQCNCITDWHNFIFWIKKLVYFLLIVWWKVIWWKVLLVLFLKLFFDVHLFCLEFLFL